MTTKSGCINIRSDVDEEGNVYVSGNTDADFTLKYTGRWLDGCLPQPQVADAASGTAADDGLLVGWLLFHLPVLFLGLAGRRILRA